MTGPTQLLLFRLDERRYALPLAAVDRAVRAVAVTPLPGAPAIVLGVIDVQGRVLPVLNVRRRLGLPDRDIRPSDWFLLARAAGRTVVLVIDESEGIVERPPARVLPSAEIAAGLEAFSGVVQLDDGLALIHDLESFLSLNEARALDQALNQASGT